MTADRRYAALSDCIDEGIKVAAARDSAPLEAYIRGTRAIALLDLGRIQEAMCEAEFVLCGPYPRSTPRFNAIIALARARIVTDLRLPETISCDATLWAACIGGAMQRDEYVDVIEQAGFTATARKENDTYLFLSNSAQGAARKYGVRSVSLLAIKR